MPAVHSIYLMTVDWSKRASAASAVYRARKSLGLDATQGGAFSLVQRCYNGGEGYVACIIGNATSEGTLALATKALDDAPLTYAVNPSPEEVFANGQPTRTSLEAAIAEGDPKVTQLHAVPDEEPAGETLFTPDEYETAMLLLVAMHGNPFGALSIAGGLAKTTGSDSYKRVQQAILKVFPADSPQAMALVAQVIQDDPDA